MGYGITSGGVESGHVVGSGMVDGREQCTAIQVSP